jgi:GNAT superfamily N-acetyltransferase
MVKTRPARETDAPFIAWVMQEAARSHLEIGMWDLAFPGPDKQRLEILSALASTDTIHFGHWSRFIIAEVDGVPAAGLSAYENSHHGPKKLFSAIVEAFKNLGLPDAELLKIPERLAPMASIKYVSHDGRWIVEWVATKPEYRGRGIIYGLLREILDAGRQQGFSESQIGYIIGNIPARNAYEKIGYKEAEQYCHPDFEKAFGEPGIAGMHLFL